MAILLSLFLLIVPPKDRHCGLEAAEALRGASYPLDRERISSSFGTRKDPLNGKTRYHAGIDLVVIGNPEVRSIEDGLVVFAGSLGGYGTLVSVQHANGYSSHYAHLASAVVPVGARLRMGQLIGIVGATGRTTAEHLHFEIRRCGHPLNPMLFVPGIGGDGMG